MLLKHPYYERCKSTVKKLPLKKPFDCSTVFNTYKFIDATNFIIITTIQVNNKT